MRPSLSIVLAGAAALAPNPTSATTIRLDAAEAVRRALATSHAVGAAVARRDAARGGVAAADSALRPTVVGSATIAERSSVPEFTAALAGPTAPPVTIFPDIRTTFGLALDVWQPLYTGGALTAAREASRLDLDSAAFGHDSAGADVALAATVAYWQAVASGASLGNAEQQERRAARLETDVHNLRAAGMAVEADVLAARARLAAARLAVVRAREADADARASLKSLVGIPDGDEVNLADPIDAELPAPPASYEELREHARGSRADLAAARSRARSLEAREKIAVAVTRPSVAAALELASARPNQRYLPLRDEWKNSWSVGLAATWTLWDGGRASASIATARAQRQVAVEELAELERRVDLEVQVARRALVAAVEAVAAADASRSAAVAREAAVRDRLSEGVAAVGDELDAQTDLTAAESDRVVARTAAWIAAARLRRAVGQ